METPIDEPVAVASGDAVQANGVVPAMPADAVVPQVDPPADAPVLSGGLAQPHGPGLFWWLTFSLIVADQITKALVRHAVPLYDTRPVIAGVVDFVHVRNEGVAFGLLNTLDLRNKWVLTTALATAALAGIAYYARQIRREERLARIGLSMVLGGAIGNLIDRVYAGYVLDFVDVYWKDWHFWAFNVADASISIGAVLVFVDLLLVKRHASHTV